MRTPGDIERPQIPNDLPPVESFGSQLAAFLAQAGLPTDDVLVPYDRRRPVFQNFAYSLKPLPDDKKNSAIYISKFAAACAVGLFDAALNYLWDETVRNLRTKVAQFDLEYFFDSAVNDTKKRSEFKAESDLEKLQDWELIQGCRKTGIITDSGFRHLDYIRDMRNHASAAHPNQNEITGLQISSWLETCILEVLSKEPDGPVIEVRRLLNNLREERLTESDLDPIAEGLPSLPADLTASLLRSIVGMYADTNVGSNVKDNIRIVAKSIWDVVEDEPRREVGVKQASLAANGEASRANLLREFIELVQGQEYLTESTLVTEISSALDSLITAHNGWHNFYHEPAPARLLQNLVPVSGSVPSAILSKYVKTLILCRIGNEYGVSWGATEYYDDLIRRFSAHHTLAFINLVDDPEVNSRLALPRRAARFQSIAAELHGRSNRPRLNELLEFIMGYPSNRLDEINADADYRARRRALRI